ncbi:MAG: hypothetical protein OXG97_08635 [Candidatus Poribacteria bacterium]|nr:hypothetical protein [Candidatus Poribacteria bacterium]
MKKKNLLYSLVPLVLIALIAGVISYATERHPRQTGFSTTLIEQSTTPVTSTETETPSAIKVKSCGCCAERMARLQERIRKVRERKQTAQHAAATQVSQQQPSHVSGTP